MINKQIYKQNWKIRGKIVLFLLALALIFNSSILTTFIIGIGIMDSDTFTQDVLNPFFKREECLYAMPMYTIG